MERYDGEVPGRLKDLVTLPGVGRKTANVVLGNAFGVPGITVDTHFGRLARRFGWTTETDPEKVEAEVGALFPRKDWTMLSHRLIWHGRRVCFARKPACGACPVAALCPSFGEGETDPRQGGQAGQVPAGRGEHPVSRGVARRAGRAGCGRSAARGLRLGHTAAGRDGLRPAEHGGSDLDVAALPPCPRLPRATPPADGLPDTTLHCLGAGPKVRLSDLRGTPMVLNVWAAWCPNCAGRCRSWPMCSASAGTGAVLRRARQGGARLRPALRDATSASTVPVRPRRATATTCAGCTRHGTAADVFVTGDGTIAGRKIGEIQTAAELDALIEQYLGVQV